uniref:Cilia and flagella associated protein 46 n=1 Tax=Stegastes partitus TaxID=144197 RepID=A0A3B5B3J4_9TELE
IKKPFQSCLKMYFEGNPPANQFLCRAYLCQGQLKSPPEDFEEAVMCFVKAIEISKHDPRYHFMVFNASVLYFQTVQPLLQPGRCLHLVPSLKQVVQSLEEVADQDHSWRAELMMQVALLCSLTHLSLKCPFQIPCILCTIHKDDAVAFLLELALLALQAKHQKVAADCLKELKSMGEAVSVRYSLKTSGVVIPQARLKEIGKLDQWLQTAVREGDPQAVQAVCATQWNFCLPLLQHSIRKRIKTPLLRVAQALEDMQSMLLEMRCQVHSELAAIEEEEGRLEASLTHLQKAMLLDNGTQQERLSSAFRLLQLRRTLYQTPPRTKDKAAMLMQQTDSRPVLVAAGLLLAPDDFQMVLDADDTSKSSLGAGPVAHLAAKAQHHSTSVEKVNGHLARQGNDTDDTERVKLWALLAKTARKQEVWDVCRAACRFCLLYDDGRWKLSKTDSKMMNNPETDLVKLFPETATCRHYTIFLYAFPTLYSISVPLSPRDWIQALSAYATSNFLRAGELGAEIREPWVVVNAAIYLWNYNSHLLAAGEYQCLLPTFQSLVEINRALFVLLCDTVAQGLIQPLSGPDSTEPAPVGEKGKNRAEKGMEKAASVHGVVSDPAALQDVRKALEVCQCLPHISGETVHIAAKKQVLATWVQIKRLLQQQIGSKMDTFKDQCGSEEVSAMTRVLVGVEMLQCNRNPRHMEFSVPSLSTLLSMASECSWSDAVVELQVWCQLAAFCHYVKDHSLVLSCTERALQLEDTAAKSLSTMPCVFLLPSHVHSFAEKADNPALCVTAARHYWNTCLPLTQSPEERWQLKEHLEKILNALSHTTKHENCPRGHAEITR